MNCIVFHKSQKWLSLIIGLLFFLFITSCNTTNENKEQSTLSDKSMVDSSSSNKKVVCDSLSQTKDTIISFTNKKSVPIIHEDDLEPSRYIEFPSDENFNGKPMTQQIELGKNVLKSYPDTLKKLALTRYKSYDQFFPKAIADDFENGVSTEHIFYPKELIFRFEVFDSPKANKPYVIEEVRVLRKSTGELLTN